MKLYLLLVHLSLIVLAARPFLNEPDTGFQEYPGSDFPKGKLPPLESIWSINDFDYAARNFLNDTAYTWIRYATGAEYTYKNNLEIFPRVGLKPRYLRGQNPSTLNASMATTILGYNFSLPIFISPAAAPGPVGGYVPPHEELGLVQGAGSNGILYIPALYATLSIEAQGAAQAPTQIMFQQLYAQPNLTFTQSVLDGAKAGGKKAIVWTIDAAADGAWVRGARFTLAPRPQAVTPFDWSFYNTLRNMTDLPIIPKGIMSVADAQMADSLGAPAIILSNHGGRHLDGVPSPYQVALEIYDQAPEIYNQTEVLADGGVRYGTDVLKFLALGVKAVGLGRSFMYANLYGRAGVERAIWLLRQEIFLDSVNLGLRSMEELRVSGEEWVDLGWVRGNEQANYWR